jgi:hypothetical protein
MTAFLSDDEGKTWRGGLLLDERSSVSYPDGFEKPDRLIHILYDWNRRTFHQAQKHPANPVFKAEAPNELAASSAGERGQAATYYLSHGGVFFDPRDRVFKMFSTAGGRGGRGGRALATSPDLLHWKRPDLGFPPGGNLLLARGTDAGNGNCVWLDVDARRLDERSSLLNKLNNIRAHGMALAGALILLLAVFGTETNAETYKLSAV